MAEKASTSRTQVRRLPERGRYSREEIDTILDEGLVCHVGFVQDGQPFVIPTGYGRSGDTLYLHGSAASRMLRTLEQGVPVCVTVTLLDALVLARSAFHHSMNYRSVVLLGMARALVDPDEKTEALRVITEHLVPGRWDYVRQPNAQELKATAVLALPIDEASAKVRTGPPKDDAEDHPLAVWAGLLPLAQTMGEPIPDPALRDGVALPEHVAGYRRAGSRARA